MGWSCTVKAGMRLDSINDFCYEQTKMTNTYFIGENKYFFETGREQADGSITGTIYKIIEGDFSKRCNQIKIAKNGALIRGPSLFKMPVLALVINGQIITRWKGKTNPEPSDLEEIARSEWGKQFPTAKFQIQKLETDEIVCEWSHKRTA